MIAVWLAGVAAAGLLGGGLLRRRGAVAAGLVGLALAYAVGLHELHGATRTLSAIAAGAGLLIVGELGFGLVDRSARRPASRSDRRRLAWLGAWGVSAAAIALVVLAVASLTSRSPIGVTALGAFAALLAVGLLVGAVREVDATRR